MAEPRNNSAVLARPLGWASLSASGPDARAWLNGLLTCDVEAIVGDRGGWSLLLNKRGKIFCDLTLVSHGDGLLLGTSADPEALFELLDGYLVMEDVEFAVAPEFEWFMLFGPRSLEIAKSEATASVAAASVAWTSEPAAALVVSRPELEACRASLEELGVVWLDEPGFQRERVQRGLPLFGQDFGLDDNPHEAGLDRRTISWTKGCYLGQEVVCMQDMRGKVKRRLTRLRVEGGNARIARGDTITDFAGNSVGSITSADPAPESGAVVAIARLKSPHFAAGSRVRIGDVTAEVLDLLPSPAPQELVGS